MSSKVVRICDVCGIIVNDIQQFPLKLQSEQEQGLKISIHIESYRNHTDVCGKCILNLIKEKSSDIGQGSEVVVFDNSIKNKEEDSFLQDQ